ncbi:MAG: metallophosphoesterase [Neisseria sp.]|nr:metallophosphoesterase [Neisseria sp.]
MSKIFFTSDLHFSHKNIAKFCPQFRPFGNVAEMDEFLIHTWNSTVSAEDTVYNLGDVSFAHDPEQIAAVLARLNGRHHLIYGNHDRVIQQNSERFLNTVKHDGHPLLSSARNYRRLQTEKSAPALILFHYPIMEWDGCNRGAYHLYGHLHDRMADIRGRALNVGFDMHGRFLTLQDIDGFLSKLPAVSYFGANTPMPSETEAARLWVEQKLAGLNL